MKRESATGLRQTVCVSFGRRLYQLSALLLVAALRLDAANGLLGQYYDTAAFGTLKTTRTDATVNFDWGTATPAGTALTSADTFSVLWTGQLEPEFSQLYTFYVTADDGARLWVNDQLVVMRTFSATSPEMRGQARLRANERTNLRLEYIEQTGSAKVKLEWSCASRAREVIPAARLFTARADKAGGALLKEHWSNIPGGAITSLTANANYPSKPSGREFITTFECLAQSWTNAYGTRVTGYLVPPESGSYTFAVSADDAAELYLSTDATTNNKALVASVSSATGFRAWDAQPSQQSEPRALVQGQRYYVELLHKENAGSDHWSVGWLKPGDTAFTVIPGSALVQPGLTTAQPAEAALLNTLAQEHPRLFATPERFARLRAAWQSAVSSQPKAWAQNAISSANTILTQDPVSYLQDVRGTILDQSRTAKDRLYKLGLAWQLTGDSQYAERAWEELSTVAAFPDWHPAHFLDTAEMTHACAIGYDWFYPYWTQARRDTIRGAIITNGLHAGLSQYTSNAFWTQSSANNWNMVCNGGLSIGALALGSESEPLAENILNRALNSTRPVWRHFTTDGGAWYEGPGYYGYTTEYGIRMLAALEGALGSDFGISSTTNLSESGFAPIHATGPSGTMFNFADAGAGGALRGPIFQWFARRYNQPLFNGWQNQGGGGALDALWWDGQTASLAELGTPPDMAFHGDAGTPFQPQEMVTLRGSWSTSRTTFVGCKGGEMGASHGNLDAGTFVLDALGKRWFHDLGGDNYALPGYFSDTPSSGVDRWDYYRMRPEGQNTLTISPSANADMVLDAVAPLIAFQSEPGGGDSFAIHDLTPVYSGVTRVWRGTRLLGVRDQVLIQDEIQASTGKTVWWFAHYAYPATAVVLEPGGTSAMLTQGSERLWCKILSGGGAFQLMDAAPLPTSPNPTNQNANAGYKKLAIALTNVTAATLAVWFVPLSDGEAAPTALPALTALNTWRLTATNTAPTFTSGNAAGQDGSSVDIDLRAYVTDDASPPEQMRFSVSGAINGTVVLLADGHTARFTPSPGTTGTPAFTVTATDSGPDPRVLLAYDFELPDVSATNTVPDASGLGRDGALDAIGTGKATLQADVAAAFARDGRSLDLAENGGANAARLSRVVAASELNFNTGDWTITGWFKRRDSASDDMIWHLNNGDGYGSGEELYLMMSGASSLTLHHYPGPDVNIVTNGVATNVWHHFSVVRNASRISLYLNGSLAGEDTSFALAINQTNALVFGGHTDTTATYAPRWFDGRLDELAVCGAALSPAEIAALADGLTVRHFGGLSATGTVTLSASPVAYVWTNALAGAALPWSAVANWSGNSAPASSRGTSIRYFDGQTLAGGAITSRNDHAGDFVLNGLSLAGTAGAASTVTITGGSLTLMNNGLTAPSLTVSATAGPGLSYDIAAPLTLGADLAVSGTGNATLRLSGPVGGAGGLAKSSAGTLTLTGANSYSGDTLIGTGTLQIGADGASGSLGTGGVINNGQLRFDRTGTLSVPNAISGTGSIYLDCPINAGTVVLTGSNSFSGNVTVNAGALRITGSTALGSGAKTVTLSNGTAGAPQLRLDGSAGPIELPGSITYRTSNASGALVNEAGSNTLSGDITLTGGGGDTKILASAGTLTLTGALAPNTTSRTLQLSGAGTGLITGCITNGGPNVLAVSKNDAGTWLLAGTNTYTGTTTLNAGTLLLGSASALGNGGPNYGNTIGGCSVMAGATLDLNGQTGLVEALTLRGSGTGGGALINGSESPASIAGGAVSSVAVTAGGLHSTVPAVMLGGPGTGAVAVASLGLTAASFTISGGTTVYSSAPSVTISGGGGSGAAATATLTAGVVSGITLTAAGMGYTSAPAIAFSGGTVTTAGVSPTGLGNDTNFCVSGVTVTSAGAGYTAAPTVFFGSGTGTAATAHLSSVALAANTTIGGSGDIRIDAPVSGSYALVKVGSGNLTLAGTNTYTGATTVSNGTLTLCGSLTSHLAVVTGTLAASGSPRTTGSLTLNSGSRFAVRIDGPAAGAQYDQLTVGGAVTLAGALDIQAATNLAFGSRFTLINNAGAGAVSGTFTNLPNNSALFAGGNKWRITYNGGSGNDVVLSLVSVPTLSDVTNRTVLANTSTEAIPVAVGDAETPADSLLLTGSSSNTTLVPNANIVLGGSGSSRTVTVTPASNQTGRATITLTVSDGTETASDSFVLSVTALAVWTNAATGVALPWTEAANWLRGAPAFSATNGTVAFLTGQTLAAGTVTASNNNAGAFQLATLRLAGTGPATGPATVALVGNGLSLGNGTDTPTFELDAEAGAGGLTYALSNAVTLAKDTAVNGSGSASFVLSGPIQGAGGLTKSGTAALSLAGANTYSGGTVLSAGAGTVQAVVTATQCGFGSGPVEIGAGSTLLVRNDNASAATVTKTNVFSGDGLIRLSFAANATARSTALPGLSGFAGTIQLTNAVSSGDKWDASGVSAPAAAVQIDSGNTLVLSGAPASFGSIAVRGAGNAEGRGALRLAFASATLAGPVTLLGDTTIAGDAAGATFAGVIAGTAGTGATQTLTQGTAASPAGCTVSGAISDGPNGGKVALVQARGKLTLSGANAFSGATTIQGGTLQIGALNTLPPANAVTLGTAGGAGSLDLSAFSQTLSSLAVASTNSALTNLVLIAANQTLTLSGAGGLTVGTDSGTNSFTRARMSGGGALLVTNAAALVTVGKAQANQNYSNSGTLDLAGLSDVTLGSAADPISELRVGFGLTSTGWLALSDTRAAIAATTLQIGHSNGGNGGTGTLILGAGTNLLSANTINIGLSKSTGWIKFASQAAGSPGTVLIGGKSSERADIVIGSKNGTGTSATPTGTLDLRGHSATVAARSLTLGKEDSNTAVYQGGAAGHLYFDSGTFTVSNLAMAVKTLACPSAATASLTVSGGVFTVVAGGSVTLASQSGAGSASGTLNLLGGTFRSQADLRDGGGSATSTLNLNGGTLDMTGRAIGSSSQRVDVVQLRAGTLMNLGPFNNGEPLVKTGPGTLSLAGTNAYTGATVVSNGTLRLTSPACLPPASTVLLLPGTTADLAFSGTQAVHAVYINGAALSAGVYGADDLSSHLSGKGFLEVEWPPSSRTMLLIR